MDTPLINLEFTMVTIKFGCAKSYLCEGSGDRGHRSAGNLVHADRVFVRNYNLSFC